MRDEIESWSVVRVSAICYMSSTFARDKGHLDRVRSSSDKFNAGSELFQGQLVATDAVQRQRFGFDHGDGSGPAVRASVCAKDIQLLDVADDRPVNSDRGGE